MRVRIAVTGFLAHLLPALAATQGTAPTAEHLAALRLRSIGPANMSGRIVDLDVNERNPYVIYAASATGGVWKSTTNGVTWHPVFEKESVHSVGDIAVHPVDTGIVWVGTGERANRQSSSWGDGVYLSTDGGRTWRNMGLRDSHHIGRVALHPSDSRVVFVAESGPRTRRVKRLAIMDQDGANLRFLSEGRDLVLTPRFSPTAQEITYLSYAGDRPRVYIMNIDSGRSEVVGDFPGMTFAPRFSPDGNRIVMSLEADGNSEIYVMDLASKRTTQITRHFSIDTEPHWTPDGRSLVFTSDRSGKPQLFQVPAAGGDPSRLTFQGEYNAKASVSWDGKLIAMAQGNGNVYRIAVLDRSRGGPGEVRALSPGNLDESPSFAPNGSMILYAAREGRRGVLYAVSANGQVRQRLVLADGDVREPAWSPYRQR